MYLSMIILIKSAGFVLGFASTNKEPAGNPYKNIRLDNNTAETGLAADAK